MALLGHYYCDVVHHSAGRHVKCQLFEYIKVTSCVHSDRYKVPKTVSQNPGHVQTGRGRGRLFHTYPGHPKTQSKTRSHSPKHRFCFKSWTDF